MEIYKDIVPMDNTCVAIGYFDGVHAGHMEVLKYLLEKSTQLAQKPVVISLRKRGEFYLSSQAEKAFCFERIGLPAMIQIYDDELGTEDALIRQMGIESVVTGERCEHRYITSDAVRHFSIPMVCSEEGEIIRRDILNKEIAEGSFEKFLNLLGHPYIIMGKVEHGRQLGRTVGMPTANVSVKPMKIQPKDGVYATIVHVSGKQYFGLTNIGTRPSVDKYGYKTIETNIFDFSEDIYGKEITLEVTKYVRGTIKFNNLEEVKEQVDKDKKEIREHFCNMKF